MQRLGNASLIALLLMAGLLAGSCAPTHAAPRRAGTSAEAATVRIPTRTLTPVQRPAPTPCRWLDPAQLVILHTNDNWGETEPCG